MSNNISFSKIPPAAMSAATLGVELDRIERIAPALHSGQLDPQMEAYRKELQAALQLKLDTANVS
jgi:hypothetical protein